MKGHLIRIAAGLAAAFALTAPAFARPASDDPALSGSTRCIIEVQGQSGQQRYSGLTSAIGKLYADGVVDVGKVQVLDYTTYGSGSEKMLSGHSAHFIVGASKAKGSDDKLDIAAFASREIAKKYQTSLGGELATFEQAWEAARAVWRKPEPATPAASAKSAQSDPPRREHKVAPADCFT